MRFLLGFLVLVFGGMVCSCEKSFEKPVSLYVGGEERVVVEGARWSEAKKEILDELKLVWDGLEQGESEEFHWEYVRVIEDGERVVRPPGENREVVLEVRSTETSISQKYRFFKHEDGRAGVECLNEAKPGGGEWYFICGFRGASWKDTRDYLDTYELGDEERMFFWQER